MSRWLGIGILTVFAVGWCGLTLGATASLFAIPVWKQWAANEYPVVEGKVVARSERAVQGETVRYLPDVTYKYQVHGKTFEGHRIRFADRETGKKEAKRIAHRYSVGQKVAVRYNPLKPSESVLEAGIRPSDFFILMFLAPFLAISGVITHALVAAAHQWWTGTTEQPEPFQVEERLGETCLRLPHSSPLGVGIAAICMLSLPMVALIALFFGSKPSDGVTLVGWGIVLFAGIYAGYWQRMQITGGQFDLVLAPGAKTISLPPWKTRRAPLSLPYSSVREIDIEQESHRDPKTQEAVSTSYIVRLTVDTGEGPRPEPITSFKTCRNHADRLVGWLREQLGPAIAR